MKLYACRCIDCAFKSCYANLERLNQEETMERFLQDDLGADSLEYALVAAGLLVVVYAAFNYLGGQVSSFVRSLPGLLGF